ncbi:SRPBCC domain-containing protein [Kamptonema cortianum]|nr:SRPBCC domain-containing protein [Geitlerinema splendidum]MDK3158643.1 SRPBCC domain-containing protein [Kamptonema cortianum]
MKEPSGHRLDPELDMVFVRRTRLSPETMWKVWTTPDVLKQWLCPQPWTVVECELDLWPGGKFFTVMRSPDGKDYPSEGCFLVIEEGKRLVWTTTMRSGYRPVTLPESEPGVEQFHFTADVKFYVEDGETVYHVTAIHGDVESRIQHEKMGFQEGWGKAYEQLLELLSQSSS